ncbi:hypothetical protein HY636_01310 [Candidatus Woesearchaeota archaeon]|nr:hypothetical protein [Candidatus Woesearchaeota archaeon]
MDENLPVNENVSQHGKKAPAKSTEDRSIEEILLADPHVVRIHHSSYSQSMFPQIDYSLWRAKKRAEREIKYLQEDLCRTYVEDDFGADHHARRMWEATKERRVRRYLDNNPLGVNAFTGMLLSVDALNEGYKGTNPNEFEVLVDLVDANDYENYNKESTQEKIEFVDRIKKRVYGLLQFLSKQELVLSR